MRDFYGYLLNYQYKGKLNLQRLLKVIIHAV